jgi:serine/threonine protein kinase
MLRRTTRKSRKGARRSTHKNKSKGKKGGAKIGEGASGVVYKPSLKCGDLNNSKYATANYVSKVTDKRTADEEMEIANYIRMNIPDYADFCCIPEKTCQFDPQFNPRNSMINMNNNTEFINTLYNTTSEAPYLIITPYCGASVESLLLGLHKGDKNTGSRSSLSNNSYYERVVPVNYEVTSAIIVNMLRAIPILISGLYTLHEHNLFHGDIHAGNILYNKSNNTLYLIDFSADIRTRANINKNAGRNTFYDCYKFDKFLLYIIDILLSSNALSGSDLAETAAGILYDYAEIDRSPLKELNQDEAVHFYHEIFDWLTVELNAGLD